MSNKRIQELAKKFAQDHNKAWQEQRQRLETFYYDVSTFLKSLINEMDGDLRTLKEKKVHPDVIRMFDNTAYQVKRYYLSINPEKPYSGIENFANWADSKENKILFDNLEFLIQEYLKNSKELFEQTPHLKHSHIHSLQKLRNIAPKLKAFIIAHPLLEDPRIVSDIPPPVGVPKELTSLGPSDETKVLPAEVLDIPAE